MLQVLAFGARNIFTFCLKDKFCIISSFFCPSGLRQPAPSISGSSQRSESGFKREQAAISSIAYRLVPRIGTRVTKLILAGSRSITNVLLRRILHYIPNLTYLDVRDTRLGEESSCL